MTVQTVDTLVTILNICIDAVLVVFLLQLDTLIDRVTIEALGDLFRMSASFFGMLIIGVRFFYLIKDRVGNKKRK